MVLVESINPCLYAYTIGREDPPPAHDHAPGWVAQRHPQPVTPQPGGTGPLWSLAQPSAVTSTTNEPLYGLLFICRYATVSMLYLEKEKRGGLGGFDSDHPAIALPSEREGES